MHQRPQPAVLIVEDEHLIRMLAVEAFLDEGFLVLEAEHAAEALLVYGRDVSIQLLFTDVNMPGEINGIDLAEHFKHLTPDLRIIITSALPILRTVDHLSAKFIPKPYQIQNVCSVARGLLAA
jgi:DNA-binding NtrC family response regulator